LNQNAPKKRCECPYHPQCPNTGTAQVSIPDGKGGTTPTWVCPDCQRHLAQAQGPGTPIAPGQQITIRLPPDTSSRTLVISDPQIQGHFFVESCKIGNIDLIVGGPSDLAVFCKQRNHVPAGQPVTIRVRSAAPFPYVVSANLM
jgi:hypothetical protein